MDRVAPHRAAASLAVCLGSLGVLLAACGGNSPSTATPASAKTSGTSFAAYRTCLSQHGVTLPSFPTTGGTRPSFPAGGFAGGGSEYRDNPKFQAAAQACSNLRPSGFGGHGGFNSTAFAAYRNCLQLHGVTLPTGGTGASPGSVPPTTFDTANPTVQAAMAACASLRPSFGTTTTG